MPYTSPNSPYASYTSEKFCNHCRKDPIPKGFKLVHPMGTPIIHSTKLGFNLFVDGRGEVWSLSEDSLKPKSNQSLVL